MEEVVRVVTLNGGVMELYPPITAESITNEFSGQAIYRSRDMFSQPLLHNEDLLPGELYYLLPINKKFNTVQNDDVNLSSSTSSSFITTPYRMSLDNQRVLKRSSTEAAAGEVLPRYNSTGVWKVKLVISPEQLGEILAQEARTEALIESVRTVAKCGHGHGHGSGMCSSVANSDQWSVASSWKG